LTGSRPINFRLYRPRLSLQPPGPLAGIKSAQETRWERYPSVLASRSTRSKRRIAFPAQPFDRATFSLSVA